MNDVTDPRVVDVALGAEPMVASVAYPELASVPPVAASVPGTGPGSIETVAPLATSPRSAAPEVAITDAAALVTTAEIAPSIVAESVSRRRFLGFGISVVAGLAGATVLSRLFPIFADATAVAAPIVPAYNAATTDWRFVVDTNRCIGCGLCVAACKAENHVPEGPAYNRTWVERHVVTADGTLHVDSPEAGIRGFPPGSTAPDAAGQPVASAFFEPRLCMQCRVSPCTSVCPVGATYRTPEGVILVDAGRCIGCGYCVTACPYGARYLVPAGGETPQGTPGVADKCTWCYHRLARALLPACVEVCPVGARTFGNAGDPESDVARIIREQQPAMLYPGYGTRPRVLYLGPATEES
jgi:tetrathionate reductase subunit B